MKVYGTVEVQIHTLLIWALLSSTDEEGFEFAAWMESIIFPENLLRKRIVSVKNFCSTAPVTVLQTPVCWDF
jgi:hypothetical protein